MKLSEKSFGYFLFLVSAYLVVLGFLPHIALPVEMTVREGVEDPQYITISILSFILLVLMLFVVIGIYLIRHEKFGPLGLVGFVLAIIGSIFNICMSFDMSFVWPVLIVHSPELVDFSGPLFRGSIFSIAHNLVIFLGTLGYLIFGISMARARVLSRTASIIFTVGMLLTGVILFPPFIIRTIGCIIVAISLIWFGVILMRNKVLQAT